MASGNFMGFDDAPPEIFTGAYFNQNQVVSNAEGLQDFRRRQEGHLIIAEDRPILVMSFGQKFEGANPAKYKIEGKYDIPIGYKCIIKWDEDEIVFMTKKGQYTPEYQIIYLPKSPVPEDFTMFEWNPSIGEIWDQFLTVVVEGKEDRNMKLFTQGPWKVFGVTRDEVQIALKQGTDKKTDVEGILYCAVGEEPTLEEYMRYIQFDPATDENYAWVCQAFMDEAKPAHMFQYVKDGMVYWVDARNQEASWKHPHFDKYKKMMADARVRKPLPHWRSIMEFRIWFLLQQAFPWECEQTGIYPPVETVDNVLEMSRIFGLDIRIEPYLVHVLKRALRHYAMVVREGKDVKDVEDFRMLIKRYRDIVAGFERQKDQESRKVVAMKVCVNCSEGNKKDAVLFCENCKDFFCQECFDWLHARGRRKGHAKSWVEMGMCAECTEGIALFHCVQCSDLYCRDCFMEWHVRGGRRNHIPIVLRSFNSQTHILPDALAAMGTGSGQQLAKARSTWFAFNDENDIHLYYNIITGECRRDMPLAVINEPINENVGGGIGGGWAGTWAAENSSLNALQDAQSY
mmetsp:Transcript_7258/g.11845  ORF Transcript_7258/g.11845 Transcript_7258/m.11845 type:complete len:571 (-) Transcript_7258:81-1793(-)